MSQLIRSFQNPGRLYCIACNQCLYPPMADRHLSSTMHLAMSTPYLYPLSEREVYCNACDARICTVSAAKHVTREKHKLAVQIYQTTLDRLRSPTSPNIEDPAWSLFLGEISLQREQVVYSGAPL